MSIDPASENSPDPTPGQQHSASEKSGGSADSDSAGPVRSSRRILVGFLAGCVLSLAIILPAEIDRWNELSGEPGTAWLFDMNVDTTPFAVLFLLLPVMWLLREPLLARPPRLWSGFVIWLGESPGDARNPVRSRVFPACLFVAVVSLVSCLRVATTPVTADGAPFAGLPPCFHDEYSYLFQAQTFAAGRLSFPSHERAARLFDQMHVLNEGRFASRYFPGTGLWMMPFLRLGNPYFGHWLATMLVCVLIYLIGRELSCNGVGLVAALLAALSPGLVLFGNLLLAHQPTLLGLSLFVYAFLRMQRATANLTLEANRASEEVAGTFRRIAVPALMAGAGLSFAMLCRPMTAAGVGLPFGIWLAWWLLRNGQHQMRMAAIIVGGFAVPLSIGFGVAGVYNLNTTGKLLKTPYQLYTELFTPRHMFGFDNVERAQPLLTERTLDHYDQWAENLDASLAVRNVQNRLLASWQWTLGLIAIVLTGTVFLVGGWKNLDRRWWLILAAIVSLHVVHVPYWYDGIFHWHYVFESSVFWCLIAAAATQLLIAEFRVRGRPWMTGWVVMLLVVSVTTNNVAGPPFLGVSRLSVGINQLAFSRVRYFNFQQLVQRRVQEYPALVLVRHDESDRHIDYVSNHPSLTGPLLIGRVPADALTTEEQTVELAAEVFPDRSLYVFDAQSGRFERIR